MTPTRLIHLRGKPVAGGKLPLICTPLVGRTPTEILAELAAVLPKAPDLLEWRVDFFTGLGDDQVVIETARDVPNSLVRVVVADTGPGIPPAEREKLFLPYYSTKGRGSGLGLAIVRRIITEHGGTVDVADAEPQGTVFTVDLPAA